MISSSIKSNNSWQPRAALRALLDALTSVWMELTRLNSLGLDGSGTRRLNRAERAALVRDRLSRKYRDRSPCC
jgi:hypothetical protein